jgi:hypothetical protein
MGVNWQALAEDWAAEDAALDARIERVRRAYQNDTLDELLAAEDQARNHTADGNSDGQPTEQPGSGGATGAASGAGPSVAASPAAQAAPAA